MGYFSQAGRTVGQNNLLEVWWMEDIGGGEKWLPRFPMVEGPGQSTAAATE